MRTRRLDRGNVTVKFSHHGCGLYLLADEVTNQRIALTDRQINALANYVMRVRNPQLPKAKEEKP